MRKAWTSIVVALAITMGLVACNLQPDQIKVIAQNAGLFSAVGWIAVDNPESEAVSALKDVLYVINEKAGDVQTGKTYTEVIYPELVIVIDSDIIDAQYRPLCKAGSLSILGGIDMLFAVHPEWKEQQDVAIGVVTSFVMGAQNGLSLASDDPIMVAAYELSSRRARLLRE